MTPEAAEILARFKTNPKLWWEILDHFPLILGPWEWTEYGPNFVNVKGAWSRSLHVGRSFAQVILYTRGTELLSGTGVVEDRAWQTAMRDD